MSGSNRAFLVVTRCRCFGFIAFVINVARAPKLESFGPCCLNQDGHDFINAFGAGVLKNLERVGRAGKPEEVAFLIAFLLSEQADWINGIDIVIDGGMGAFALAAG